MTEQIRSLMHVAEIVAREAADLVREGREGQISVAATKSSAQDVVTAMDLASEALLRRRLAELRPDDGLLGEEGSLTPSSSGIWWVVDPIDGTVNYLYGLPAYAVSVAAVSTPGGTAPDPATWTVLARLACSASQGIGSRSAQKA